MANIIKLISMGSTEMTIGRDSVHIPDGQDIAVVELDNELILAAADEIRRTAEAGIGAKCTFQWQPIFKERRWF